MSELTAEQKLFSDQLWKLRKTFFVKNNVFLNYFIDLALYLRHSQGAFYGKLLVQLCSGNQSCSHQAWFLLIVSDVLSAETRCCYST